MANYPKANTTSQNFASKYGGSKLTLTERTMVVVLHTTEGINWPSYNGGSSAPNYTGLPPIKGKRSGSWRAHFPDNMSSRALRNESGGVQTNTLNAMQLELIGTCDPKHRYSWNGQGTYKAGVDYVYWPEADEYQLDWLADLLAYFNTEYGLQIKFPKKFNAYPGSYGKSNRDRMSFAQWRSAVGIVGHQHVPENSHGDPGNINTKLLGKLINDKIKPSTTRGFRIDKAISLLEKSEGKGARRKRINNALKALKGIKHI